MDKQLFSIRDAARLVGVPEHRLGYAHRAGFLAEPTFVVAGKRIYTTDDLRRVKDYFANKKPWQRQAKGGT